MSKELTAVVFALLALFGLAVATQPGADVEVLDPPAAEIGVGIEPGG